MTPAIDAAAASGLIAAIYDCALAPDRWRGTLGLLQQQLGFADATFAVNLLPSGVMVRNETSGVPDNIDRRIADPGRDGLSQWGGADAFAALPPEEPAVLSRVNPCAAIPNGQGHRDPDASRCLIDAIGVVLARDAGMVASLIMGRPHEFGPITDADVAALRQFVPHLQRVAAINRDLDLRAAGVFAFRQFIDALAAPVFFVDEQLNLIHANEVGRALLASGDLLREEQGRLRLVSSTMRGVLQQAVERACGLPARAADESGRAIPLFHGDGRLSALHVLPLTRPDGVMGPDERSAAYRPRCTLFLSGGRAHSVAASVVASAFGLTAAEMQVFALIASGLTVSGAAAAIGVRPSTVRTHLLRLFSKTGTHRQVDLALLADRLGGP